MKAHGRWIVACGLYLCLCTALAGCFGPDREDAPKTKDGQPVLVDVARKFQITLPYYEIAMTRVPLVNRAQYLSTDGKRKFLEKITIEVVFYLEAVRRKQFNDKEVRKNLVLRTYNALIEEVRRELLKGVQVTDEQVRAEYDASIQDPAKHPFDAVKEEIRLRLTNRELDKVVQAKKDELREAWKVQVKYELLDRLNPKTLQAGEALPSIEEALAEGLDYRYTIAQFLQRLDAAPQDVRQKIRDHPNPHKLLDYVIGEDLLHKYGEKQGLDKTPDYELRRKLVEVGTLSQAMRKQILGKDIVAKPTEIRAYYEKHKAEFERDGEIPSLEQIKDLVAAQVTDKKREDATRSLAKSLMAHRYKTVYFEPNIKQHLP